MHYPVWLPAALAGSVALNLALVVLLVVSQRDCAKAWALVRHWHAHHKQVVQKLSRMYEAGWRLPESDTRTRKWTPPSNLTG